MTASLFMSPGLFSVFWPISNMMISTFSLISKTFSPTNNPFGIVPTAAITIGITVTFMFHSFFSSLAMSRYLSLFTPFLKFYSVFCQDGKVDYSAFSLFLPEKVVCLILLDGFRNVHIPLVRIDTFHFLTQFLVDHFPHPVVSCPTIFLG